MVCVVREMELWASGLEKYLSQLCSAREPGKGWTITRWVSMYVQLIVLEIRPPQKRLQRGRVDLAELKHVLVALFHVVVDVLVQFERERGKKGLVDKVLWLRSTGRLCASSPVAGGGGVRFICTVIFEAKGGELDFDTDVGVFEDYLDAGGLEEVHIVMGSSRMLATAV